MRYALLLAGLLLLVLSGEGRAHSWYETSCCSGYDCHPLAENAVREVKSGWLVTHPDLSEPTIVPFEQAKPSGDEKFHACIPPGSGQLRCLYAPARGV